jgi:hypothetical protein
MNRRWQWAGAVAVVLLASGPALAQGTRTSTAGSFTGSTGGFTGSTGGMTGSTGGFTGGSTFGSTGTGGFTGGTTFGTGTTGVGATLGGRGGTGAANYSTTSPFGQYWGNPYAAGLPNTSPTATQYLRKFPVALNFGSALYNLNPTTITATQGTATIVSSRFAGPQGLGLRRAPAYVTMAVFDYNPAPPAAALTEARAVIARSSRLPSRGNVRVTLDGNVFVLRGDVRDTRELQLVEAVLRLTPGVRAVRNELRPLRQ